MEYTDQKNNNRQHMNNTEKKLLLVEYINFEADMGMLHESLDNPNKPFLVRGIVQRKGAKNQNGRIYPDGILETLLLFGVQFQFRNGHYSLFS